MPLYRFLLSVALLCGTAPAALAQIQLELSWGSSFVEEKMILSDGTSLDPSQLIIELGSFDNSFIPQWNNMADWLTEWRVFDAVTDTDPGIATTDPDPQDFFTNVNGGSETVRFAGEGHLLADGTGTSEDAMAQNPFYTWSPEEEGYIFIRTSDDFVETSQWLLFRSAVDSDGAGLGDAVWEFPPVSGGQPQITLEWFLSQADDAIVGAIHGGSGVGGDTGVGTFTDSSTDFVLRLHNIPEPETWIYALIPAAILIFRRRI